VVDPGSLIWGGGHREEFGEVHALRKRDQRLLGAGAAQIFLRKIYVETQFLVNNEAILT